MQEIHCDGSFSQSSSAAGYGIVITDTHGQVTNGYSGTLVCASPVVVEAKALLEAIKNAPDSGIPTSVRTDCLSLVDGLRKRPDQRPWQCSAWMHLMDDILRSNPLVKVSFTPRRLNVLADRAAKAAATGTPRLNWINCAYFTNSECNNPFQPP
ncbi:hypothetical protein LINGRAPRIM_LOCUS1126 [Linum grandiflorum]